MIELKFYFVDYISRDVELFKLLVYTIEVPLVHLELDAVVVVHIVKIVIAAALSPVRLGLVVGGRGVGDANGRLHGVCKRRVSGCRGDRHTNRPAPFRLVFSVAFEWRAS